MKKIIFSGIVLIIGFSVFLMSSTETGNEVEPLFSALKRKNAVSSIVLPQKISFAGEEVPLNNFDTRESLEREMIVNTYWHSQTMLLLKRSYRYFPMIEKILADEGVPDDFKYLAVAESGLTHVISPAKAVGFWQILKGTGQEYGLEINEQVDERYHIEKATRAACAYLKDSYEKYENWGLAAASYNAGRGFVSKQIERQQQNSYYDLLLGDEAGRYLFRMLALKVVMSKPENYGFYLEREDLYAPIPFQEIEITESIDDFGTFALKHQTNYKMLKHLNTWLRKPYLNVKDSKKYIIRLPKAGARKVDVEPESNPPLSKDKVEALDQL